MKGQFKANSGQLNTNKDQGYHDGSFKLHNQESRLIEGAIMIARQESLFGDKTISVAEIFKYWSDRDPA